MLGHNIVLTPEERKVFGQLFQAADRENLGVVTGEQAVSFFEKSGLNPRILGEVCFTVLLAHLGDNYWMNKLTPT